MPDNAPKNPNEIEITLLSVTPKDRGMFSAKQNKTYWFAFAEIPTPPMIGNRYSTLRLESMRNEPFPSHWQTGAKVRAVITNVKGSEGKGSIDVA